MDKDIKYLLLFILIALGITIWCQTQPFYTSVASENTQHFTTDISNSQSSQLDARINSIATNNNIKPLFKKEEQEDKNRSARESQNLTSKIVDNILRNENKNRNAENELDSMIGDDLISNKYQNQDRLLNPMNLNIDNDRNTLSTDQEVLDELINEVTSGNDLLVNSPQADLYRQKASSINSAKKYRNISYADSKYRSDFNDDGSPSLASENELDSMYTDSLVFNDKEYNTNENFKGFNETSDDFGPANLTDFTPKGKQTQQQKIQSLYNANEYLPNDKLLDKSLTKGFQILNNPVSVSNPNLIPVLKSIPVSSVMGSNRNSTYDIRAEPPCPKTVVSPFLNSSIMPDIYATQRGCL